MAALTLAMNQLQDVNSEEFLALRGYYICGEGTERQVLRRTSSPVSDFKSIPASCFDDIILPLSPLLSLSSSGSTLYETESSSCTSSVEKVFEEFKQENLTIVHGERNILNLLSNITPLSWQISSPLYGYTKRPLANHHGSAVVHDVTTCKKCGFSWAKTTKFGGRQHHPNGEQPTPPQPPKQWMKNI